MFPIKFRFIWPSSFRGEDFLKLVNQKQELPVVAMFVNGSDEMSSLYRGPSKDASYQGSVHLAMRFQRRRNLRNQPFRNKNCQWPPCLFTDQAEMSNLYKGPWIDASYQVPIHLAKWFQRRRFKKIGQSLANQNKELPVAAMFANGSGWNDQSL